MRHGKKVIHLGRKVAHRKSMLANMACSLIQYKRINTTLTKAKALKQFIEPLVTKSKSDTTHNRRNAFSALRDKFAVSELFNDIAQKVGDRPGGYTRVVRMGNRLGDNASMAMIELVDFNEVYNNEKETTKKSTRRGRAKKTANESDIATEEISKTAPVATEEKAPKAKSEDNTDKKVDNSNDSTTDEADKK
jgi:large subunit ribosomal protein L17